MDGVRWREDEVGSAGRDGEDNSHGEAPREPSMQKQGNEMATGSWRLWRQTTGIPHGKHAEKQSIPSEATNRVWEQGCKKRSYILGLRE